MTASLIGGAPSALHRALGLLRRSQMPYSILDQGLVSGLGFLTGIAAARMIGIEEFGRFAVVIIVASLAQAVHNALIVAPAMSLVGARRGCFPPFIASVLGATWVTSLPLALALMGLLAGIEYAEGKPVWAGFILSAGSFAAAQNLLLTVRRLQFALGRGRDGLAMDAARGVLLAMAFVLVRATGFAIHVDTVIWILAITAAVPAVIAMLPLLRAGRSRAMRIRALLRRCWPYSKWMLPTVGLTFGQEQVVWLLVGAVLGDAAVGGLRGAQYVVSLAYPFLAALENVVPVQASQAYKEGGVRRLRAYTGRLLLIFSPLACGFPLVTALSAEFWLRLFFGPAFQAYAGCLRIFALVVVFVFVRDVLSWFFRAVQNTRITFAAFVSSSVVTMAAMVPLVRDGGVIGASVAIATGQGVSMAFLIVCAFRTWRRVS